MSSQSESIIVKRVSPEQIKDTGMALTLLMLLLFFIIGGNYWISMALIILLINMIYPKIYHYPALAWFSIANILGMIASKVLLIIIFYLIITPVGIIRRILANVNSGKIDNNYDSMGIHKWKNGKDSVFKVKNKEFTAKDMKNPY